jgi:tetratricopeptide (TPR) repeat protein
MYIEKIEEMFRYAKTAEERRSRGQEIAQQLKKAKSYFNDGKLIDAKMQFETILSLEPENKEAAGFMEKIERALTEARKQMARSLFVQGQAYYDKKMYKEAIRNWENVIEIDPEHKDAGMYIEFARKKLKEIEEKKKETEEKKKKEKMKSQIKHYFDKGVSLHKSGKWSEAKAAFEWVLKRESNNIKAKEYIRDLEVQINKLTQENKEKAHQLYTQGLRAYTSKNLKKAIELWEKALQLDPSHVKAKKSLERAKEEIKSR